MAWEVMRRKPRGVDQFAGISVGGRFTFSAGCEAWFDGYWWALPLIDKAAGLVAFALYPQGGADMVRIFSTKKQRVIACKSLADAAGWQYRKGARFPVSVDYSPGHGERAFMLVVDIGAGMAAADAAAKDGGNNG